MRYLKSAVAILFLFLTCAMNRAGLAQAPRLDPLKSPEVLSDHRVTFRLRAAQAKEVSMFGDWMPIGTKEPLKRDEKGVWSITLGPLAAGDAIYNFYLDSLPIADPINPHIKLRARTSASIVDVPGDGTELWQPLEVPHGLVELNWEKSKVIDGQTREFRVYVPPGYHEQPGTRYPVLYLLHGSNDTAAGWTDVGHANFILDNLIAQKRAKPMIVVMPWGHAVPFDAPREIQAKNNSLFEKYVLEDLIPTVEARYRTLPGREDRAIVGLSMGGGQAMLIGLNHLDLFSYVGGFSAAVPGDFESRFHALLENPQATNDRLTLFWFGCGQQDTLFGRSKYLDALLTSHQIRHTFRVTDGRHNYTLWRQYLGEVTPLLFAGHS